MTDQAYAGDLSASQAWTILQQDPNAVLVDVRTRPEWSFVGLPDLSVIGKRPILIEWQIFPTMARNVDFAEELAKQGVDEGKTILFLCRSGARSAAAATLMTALGWTKCYNIQDGFEGPHDDKHHRGTIAGWKAAALPWVQG